MTRPSHAWPEVCRVAVRIPAIVGERSPAGECSTWCARRATITAQAPEPWRWRGSVGWWTHRRRCRTPLANQAAYPQPRESVARPWRSPVPSGGHSVSGAGAALCGYWPIPQGKGGDEQTLLRVIPQTLERGDLAPGPCIFTPCIFCCGYAGANWALMRYLSNMGPANAGPTFMAVSIWPQATILSCCTSQPSNLTG